MADQQILTHLEGRVGGQDDLGILLQLKLKAVILC